LPNKKNGNQKRISTESVAKSTTDKKLVSIFNKRLGDFQPVTGYLALAVAGKNEDILVSHQSDQTFNFQTIVGEMKGLLSVAEDSDAFKDFGQGKALTFHMEKYTVLIVSGNTGTASDLFMVGVTKQYGNWMFIKTLMQKLLHEIKSNI